jgi:RNA polymerase sigma factor (sigma-70 family)
MLRLIRGRADSPPAESPGPPAEAARPDDDLALLARASAGGDRRALRTLLSAVGPSMLQVIRRVLGFDNPDVEDAFQEAALGLVEALRGFRGECSTLHFASRVAVLTAVTWRRRQRTRARHAADGAFDEERALPGLAAETPSTETLALGAQRRVLLRQLIDELPEPQAEVLVLHCVGGFTLDEVASTSGIPLETARSRLRLAKRALRTRIEDAGLAVEMAEKAE